MNRRLLVLPLLAVLAYAFYAYQQETTPQTLAISWRHGEAAKSQLGRNYDKLPADTPLQLSLHSDAPVHVYVYSQSREDGTLLLFPAPQLVTDLQNPLPAGHSMLPGQQDGKELCWTSRSGVHGASVLLAVVSKEPLPELDALAGSLRQWSNRVFPDQSMVVTKPAAGVAVAGAAGTDWPHPLLRAAAGQLATQVDPNGPLQGLAEYPGIYISSWKLVAAE